MVENGLRLGDIWEFIPENHVVVLRVQRPENRLFYTAYHYQQRPHDCPYERKFAHVIGIYAIERELIEIRIKENIFVKG